MGQIIITRKMPPRQRQPVNSMSVIILVIASAGIGLIVGFTFGYNKGWNNGKAYGEKKDKRDYGAEAFKLRDEIQADQREIDRLQRQIDMR